MVINNYLGIKDIPSRAQQFIRRFFIFQLISTFLLVLSTTFFVLYSIDNIGFALTSFTLSFMFLIQLIFDYPSGSLGDWIGQRWVLIISYSCYSVAFFLMSTAQSFTSFMFIAFFNGFGNAQNSGAIATWLDNNYKRVIGTSDPDNKIYGFSRSRSLTMSRMASAISFIIGGTLATVISRQFVFGLQSILTIFVIILVYILIKDEKTDDERKSTASSLSPPSNYFTHLTGGLKFLVGNRAAFF
ncbi:MAG: MFS transporter, partial [Candidatus Hodarchaeales archaeon]